jgi:chemotaxis protein MotA
MDLTTVFGILIGIGGILLGNWIEDGHASALVQGASFVIVMAGTAGAVIVSSRRDDLKLGIRMLGKAFQEDSERESEQVLRSLMDCARLAKKESLLALEAKIPNLSNEFMQTALRSVLDGMDPQLLEDTLQQQLDVEEDHLLAGARIWIDAGGFAPTIGIIGAVLGLIHVMGNLTDTSKLGSGIAVAFVATIYGVGFANLLFLPIGNKLKRKIQQDMKSRHMIIAGALGIQAGLSPTLLEMKLRAYLGSSYETKK